MKTEQIQSLRTTMEEMLAFPRDLDQYRSHVVQTIALALIATALTDCHDNGNDSLNVTTWQGQNR